MATGQAIGISSLQIPMATGRIHSLISGRIDRADTVRQVTQSDPPPPLLYPSVPFHTITHCSPNHPNTQVHAQAYGNAITFFALECQASLALFHVCSQ